MAARRLKVFCTDSGHHGPFPVAEYSMRDAGRADLDSYLQGVGDTPGWVVDASGRRKLPLRPCPRCAEPRQRELDFTGVQNVLDQLPPGRVLRWDASTGRLLNS
jgi:hypothetical protein